MNRNYLVQDEILKWGADQSKARGSALVGGGVRPLKLETGSFTTEFKPISRDLKLVKYFLILSIGVDYDTHMSFRQCHLEPVCYAGLEMSNSITLSGDMRQSVALELVLLYT